MAYPAVRPLPKLPLLVRPETRTTPSDNYVFGQNMTEHNPAPSPSSHPLLSGPPTLNDIHQNSDVHLPFRRSFDDTKKSNAARGAFSARGT